MQGAIWRAVALAIAACALFCASALIATNIRADEASGAEQVTWTTDDFTYGDYREHFYGCDYSRQFDVAGTVITGFSDAGQAKLDAGATDLIIPAKTSDGDLIVGIGDNAFEEKGLTSVEFPTGMMCAYEDTLTNRITKRGNFVIGNSAFMKNKLTSVYLPQGVLVVEPNAFMMNQLTEVTLPRTIWWVETQSFAHNQISKVNFPATTDFQLEMHGMPFADNQITSVRLPDFTEVVNMYTFAFNPGMEPLPADAPDKFKTYTWNNVTKECGLVYMYADTVDFETKERIHHIDRTTANTKSWVQKLVVNKGTAETQNPDTARWTVADFTYGGENNATVTGLSESGIAKRAVNKHLIIPSYNADGYQINAIASTESSYGLFATADEGFETVELPDYLKTIGDRAFAGNGLTEVIWAPRVESIGLAAFQRNSLTSVVLPDTVTELGGGAFGSNPTLERVDLSAGLTEIADGAFGCSDAKNWMTNFTEVEITDGITRIGNNAFAGNNFANIVVPKNVKEIGKFAFSTKNYLKTPCTLTLPEGLETIGDYAFRNKIIASVQLPTTVKALPAHMFHKAYHDGTTPLLTRVYISSEEQWNDQDNFPRDCYGITVAAKEVNSHRLYQADENMWSAADFTYGDVTTADLSLPLADDVAGKLPATVHVVTGLSDEGKERLKSNADLVVPVLDSDGTPVCGVASHAFENLGLKSVTLSNDVLLIGANAFRGNALASVELPEGVLVVCDRAFSDNALVSVRLSGTLFYLGDASFADNGIEHVDFAQDSDSALSIGDQAFAGNALTAVQLPSNAGYVHESAFARNRGIDEVTGSTGDDKQYGVVYLFVEDTSQLGSGVTSVANGSSAVQDVVEGTLPSDDTWGASDFTYEGGTVTGWSATGKVKRLTNHVLQVPASAPDGAVITAIGTAAFRSPDREVDYDSAKYDYQNKYGYALTEVTLPSTLESIGDEAFLYNGLTGIELPQGLTSIGATAFKGNHIVHLSIPDSATQLGEGAFSANSIIELKLPAGLKTIPAGAFSMNIRLEHIDLPQGLTEIGDTAFAGARLTSLEIPPSVTKIGRKAFHLHRIAELSIPGTVKEIGDNAFEGTFKAQTLTTLTLGEGIESIGAGAFKEGLLTTVALPSSLKTMGAEPFENNTGTNLGEGREHVVILTTANKAHLAFNTDANGNAAKYHLVQLQTTTTKTSLATAKVTVAGATYNGRARTPAPKVVLDGITLRQGTDYTVSYKNNVKAGKATATVTGIGSYSGTAFATFTIAKAAQPLKASAKKKTVTVKAKKLKKSARKVKNLTVKKARGKVTYKNVSVKKKAKKFKVSSKGVVTVTKKLKKGTYTVKVRVRAKGTANYKAGSKVVTFKVRVK